MQNRETAKSEARDFDVLAASSSDALAYKTEDNENTATDLNLTRLHEALDTIPLHERLQLPKELLLPEQIAEFERNATQRLKAFDEELQRIVTSEIRTDTAHVDFERMVSLSRDGAQEEVDTDDEEDEVDPNNIVDWLDKVLSN